MNQLSSPSISWSELECDNMVYHSFDDNQKSVLGFLLVQLGVELTNIDNRLFEKCEFFDSEGVSLTSPKREKVSVADIIGTCRKDYASPTWLHAYIKLKRCAQYIMSNVVTRGKYFRMLKTSKADNMVTLIKTKNGKYFIHTNGNHRVAMYKLMANTDHLMHSACLCQQYHASKSVGQNRNNLYWLYAEVREIV